MRDRALIGLMAYSFARIGAALAMKVEDVYTQNRRLWVRLREKGGKARAMPCQTGLLPEREVGQGISKGRKASVGSLRRRSPSH